MTTNEEMIQAIWERVNALGETPNEDRIRDMIRNELSALQSDETFVRKMRFGGGAQHQPVELVGTKYARWGLDAADIEWMYDLQESLRGMPRKGGGVYAGPGEELKRVFSAVSQANFLPAEKVREIDRQALDDLFPRVPLNQFGAEDRKILARAGKDKDGLWRAWQDTEAFRTAMRAMDTAESGFGSQLIGAQYVGDLWEGARPESRVFNLLNTFEMTAPTAYLPVEAALPEMLFVSESTAADSSAYTTVKTGSNRVQVDAKKFVIHQMWSGEMEEDSILPFVPFLRRQAMYALAHYSDSLVLNGDTTNAGTGNINLNDADPADTKHYLALDGIRHAAIVDATGQCVNHAGAALTYDALFGLKGYMVDSTYLMDWGHPVRPEDVVYIADPATVDKAALLDEVITVDKFGPGATVLTGQQSRIGQHPLISSIAMSKTEADGKVSTTAGNNTLGQAVAFNRRGYVAGWRRRIRLETERIPSTDQSRLIYSLRIGLGRFSSSGAASGIKHTAVLRNISLA